MDYLQCSISPFGSTEIYEAVCNKPLWEHPEPSSDLGCYPICYQTYVLLFNGSSDGFLLVNDKLSIQDKTSQLSSMLRTTNISL